MDHDRAPLLEALAEYQRLDRYGFTPPGHRHGRGADPRTIDVLGLEPFRDDVLASMGLDDQASWRRCASPHIGGADPPRRERGDLHRAPGWWSNAA
jgi:hypothetical protein